jgi:hypothetical protein
VYENPTGGKMIFDGSVYDPNQHKWMHNVSLDMPTPF